MPSNFKRGTIVRIVRDKNFGFIRDLDSTEEYFFHRSALTRWDLLDEIKEGQLVEFTVEESTKGPRAGVVTLL